MTAAASMNRVIGRPISSSYEMVESVGLSRATKSGRKERGSSSANMNRNSGMRICMALRGRSSVPPVKR